jgi:hypothetical protein
MDATGSGSCPVAGSGINCVESYHGVNFEEIKLRC